MNILCTFHISVSGYGTMRSGIPGSNLIVVHQMYLSVSIAKVPPLHQLLHNQNGHSLKSKEILKFYWNCDRLNKEKLTWVNRAE